MSGLIFYLIIVSGASELDAGEPYRWIQYGPFLTVADCQEDQRLYGKEIGGVMSACYGRESYVDRDR